MKSAREKEKVEQDKGNQKIRWKRINLSSLSFHIWKIDIISDL